AHENVLLCHGLLEIGGQVTQVEELAHEVSLEALVEAADRTKSPIDVKLALWIARQMLEAVVHAESLGFVHGNLSPKHVYVTRDGAIKVDYGVARPAEVDADRAAIAAIAREMIADAPVDPALSRALDPKNRSPNAK